jgi:RimJ/RimL family protein N-acetyltransferase
MLTPSLVHAVDDLQQILLLQKANLKQYITAEEIQQQGFVTLQHTLPILQEMHLLAPSVIIKDGDKIAAYALTEVRECRSLMPNLEPLFILFDTIQWNNQPLNNLRYYVMGQICVAKPYRGMGLVEMLYRHHKKTYQSRFDLFVTEISTRNHRSIRAHEKVGFKTIHTHRHNLDEWVVAGWDWT